MVFQGPWIWLRPLAFFSQNFFFGLSAIKVLGYNDMVLQAFQLIYNYSPLLHNHFAC